VLAVGQVHGHGVPSGAAAARMVADNDAVREHVKVVGIALARGPARRGALEDQLLGPDNQREPRWKKITGPNLPRPPASLRRPDSQHAGPSDKPTFVQVSVNDGIPRWLKLSAAIAAVVVAVFATLTFFFGRGASERECKTIYGGMVVCGDYKDQRVQERATESISKTTITTCSPTASWSVASSGQPRRPKVRRGCGRLPLGMHEDRTPTHGYEATCEAAMGAFAKSWRRE
jgi:hypothetical protein